VLAREPDLRTEVRRNAVADRPVEAFTRYQQADSRWLPGIPEREAAMDTHPMTRARKPVLPQNERYLRDIFGSPLRDGACVLDADHEVGYVRLEFGTRRGPDSAYWDGWFSVTPTRDGHPLSGKLTAGRLVQLLGRAS
jgi:hypothetical protein